jgi:prepilin-type processing-associated H-X9-DG protein
VNVSINPSATFITTGIVDSLSFALPVLIGIDFSGHELIIGPRLIDQLFFNGVATGVGGGPVNVLYAGGSVGIALRISSSFRMLPEVAIAVPVYGTAPGGAASTTLGGGLIFQVGVGFLLGTENQYDAPQAAPVGPPPPPLPPEVSPPPIMPPPVLPPG